MRMRSQKQLYAVRAQSEGCLCVRFCTVHITQGESRFGGLLKELRIVWLEG